ncbi:MAG TPA: hypothetical protein H9887_07735, partial [Candidatus Dorea intestinavium]|nr:hypothetical protein [Candidatus Dorea intestinavium]
KTTGAIINIKGGMIEAIGGQKDTSNDSIAGIGYAFENFQGDDHLKVNITGGSVKSDINEIPTNGADKPVYKNTLTIGDPSIGDGKSVTGAEIDGDEDAYGFTDVVTSDDGKVYFWLPESDEDGSVMLKADDQEYKEAWQRGKADNTEKTLLKNISAQEPEIQSQPTDMSLIAGDPGTLGVLANVSDGELSFQWYKNTTNSTEGAEKINEANKSTYSPDTSKPSKYFYYVVVTNTLPGNVFEKTKSITSDIVKVLALELNETPETKIDYKNEMLTDLVPNGIYEINGLVRQADNEGKISIQEEWIGNELSIIHKGEEDKLTTASEAQEITLGRRLEIPQRLKGIDETIVGENDGIIEGLDVDIKYEYSKEGDSSWKTINNSTEIADLSPGAYYVRSIPKDDNEEVFKSNSAIVEISAGIVPNRTLKIKAPVFEDITIGDKQPGAKEIEITNSGNLDVTIDSVTVKGEGFKVSGDGDKVGPQEMITSWKIQPEENLAYGTYKATIVVTYDGTEAKTAEAELSFTINKINEINYKADGEDTYKSGDYTITADGDIDKFETLLCDNTEVNKKDFSVKSGSTIATIKESYMKTLSEGEHTFTFLFEDGEANHTVKVLKENESTDTKPGANTDAKPGANTDAKSGANTDAKSGVSGSAKTGDGASLPLWIFLMFASSALLIHSQRNRKEK